MEKKYSMKWQSCRFEKFQCRSVLVPYGTVLVRYGTVLVRHCLTKACRLLKLIKIKIVIPSCFPILSSFSPDFSCSSPSSSPVFVCSPSSSFPAVLSSFPSSFSPSSINSTYKTEKLSTQKLTVKI